MRFDPGYHTSGLQQIRAWRLTRRLPEFVFLAGLLYICSALYSTLIVSESNIADRLAPGNVVTMYSLTTCAFCAEKRARLTAAGIPFTEYFVDTDETRLREFMKLLESNHVNSGVGTPTLVVNNVLLVNNPSMDTIKKHLKLKPT